MRNWNRFSFLGMTFLLLAAGCMNLDYVGREFPATPPSEKIAYFQSREELPPGEFLIIGRATLTAPEGTLSYDIRQRLLEKARACGADAVCLVRARKIEVGMFDREDPTPFGPQKPLDPANTAFHGAPSSAEAEKAEYGPPVTLQGEEQYRSKVVVQALILKKKAEVEKLIAEQNRELKAIEKIPSKPTPPATKPVAPQQ